MSPSVCAVYLLSRFEAGPISGLLIYIVEAWPHG